MKTKNRVWHYPFIMMGLLLILANGYEKDEEPTAKITDKDGNVYTSETIGTQVWLAENLKTTKYLNGDPIPSNLNATEWWNTTYGAVRVHPNNIYGNFYNAYSVIDSRKICPSGWHVPSAAEWETLITNLGGKNVAGGKMKEVGDTHWNNPNTGASNQSRFTGLPAGATDGATIYEVGLWCGWWSTTQSELDGTNYTYLLFAFNTDCLRGQYYWRAGFSVRCLKDQ